MSVVIETSAPADILLPSMVVVDMVWPDQSNHHGTLFGGAALSMLDRLAFIMGSKVLRGSVVTAAVSRLDFAAPARRPSGGMPCAGHPPRAPFRHRGRTVDCRRPAQRPAYRLPLR